MKANSFLLKKAEDNSNQYNSNNTMNAVGAVGGLGVGAGLGYLGYDIHKKDGVKQGIENLIKKRDSLSGKAFKHYGLLEDKFVYHKDSLDSLESDKKLLRFINRIHDDALKKGKHDEAERLKESIEFQNKRMKAREIEVNKTKDDFNREREKFLKNYKPIKKELRKTEKQIKPYLKEGIHSFKHFTDVDEKHFKPIVGYHGDYQPIIKNGLIGGAALSGAYGLKKAYDYFNNRNKQQ